MKSLGTDSKNTVHPVYVKQVPGKTKDHCLEKYKANILINEVTTLRNLTTGPMKRLKDNIDAPEPCQKHLQVHRKKKFISFARGRRGTPGCVND